jgi:transcriptional regulator with XRE-family HTH domain
MHLRFVFSANLKGFRSERGLSQSDLALRAGLNRSYLSRLENGKNDPRLEIVGKLAKVLGVTPAQLLTRSERTNPSEESPSSAARLRLTPDHSGDHRRDP